MPRETKLVVVDAATAVVLGDYIRTVDGDIGESYHQYVRTFDGEVMDAAADSEAIVRPVESRLGRFPVRLAKLPNGTIR